MNAGEQGAAGFLREVQHDVAKKDNVETIGTSAEWELWSATVGLPEVANLLDHRLRKPVFPDVLEIANHEACG